MRKQLAVAAFALVLLAGVVFEETAVAQGPDVPLPPAEQQEGGIGVHSNPTTSTHLTSDVYWADKVYPASTPQADGAGSSAPTASGGPDDYGYTWTDNVSLGWINAAGGFDTGINNNVYSAGPIAIGFNFKFYENTYSDVWISRYGYLSFSSSSLWNIHFDIPSPERPNDTVAPFAMHTTAVNGYVRYLRGGSAPNRWFAVEWNRLASDYSGLDEYTFEVILYESGQIVFQYGAMNVNGYYDCVSAGIEDSTGIDGLATSDYCASVPSDRDVQINRPGPAARVKVFPFYYGRFVKAGEQAAFTIPVTNSGDAGPDTYDVTVASRWPVRLYQGDGVTPLTDSDGDGTVDTGSMSSGQLKQVVVKVLTPPTSSAGNSNRASITFRSSRNQARAKTATLQAALAAPFAQSFVDSADGALKLQLTRPDNQSTVSLSPDYYYGNYMAIAEGGNGSFLYAWSKGRCINSCNLYVYDIEYEVLDHLGNIVRGISKLTDNGSATVSTYDASPVVAASGDGRTGVLWRRYRYDSSGRYNYNIYFAVIGNGAILSGPTNITNNSNWGSSGDPNYIGFFYPTIAATNDNRFVLSWMSEHQENGSWIDNVWYAVVSSNGGIVRDKTRLTNDIPGSNDGYYSPSLTGIAGNRAALFLDRQGSDIYFAVLSSDGAMYRSLSQLTNDGVNWGRPDAVTMSNGSMLVAWFGDLPTNPGEQPWTAQYYNNETLSGSPALTRTDSRIDFDWWVDSPAPQVNSDFFSVRWEGTINVAAGAYRFSMGSDDGSRLWIDGQLVMDYWSDCCRYWDKKVDLAQGAHQVRMEMREHDGAAWASLSWQEDGGTVIRYAVVDSAFQTVAGPITLQNDASLTGNADISVAADGDGNAILTWADGYGGYYPNLYYALIDGANGAIVTQPMIFRTSEAADPDIYVSYEGAANTSYRAQPRRTYIPATPRGRTDFCEPNGGLSQARCPLISGQTYRASISSPGEWDFYIIDLPADHVVEIRLYNIPAGHDYDLYLYDAVNNQVGFSALFGNQSEQITTSVVPGGRYYVAVKGVEGSSTSLRYSLKADFR